jgi:hypothetical protein
MILSFRPKGARVAAMSLRFICDTSFPALPASARTRNVVRSHGLEQFPAFITELLPHRLYIFVPATTPMLMVGVWPVAFVEKNV